MVEKKYSRISVRVPSSWKRTCHERGISISLVCRSALFQAMNQSEIVLANQGKLRSLQRATALYNALKPFFVRTNTCEIEAEMMKSPFKLGPFREIYLARARPEELIVIGEFLEQGEYAEELLQQVYK